MYKKRHKCYTGYLVYSHDMYKLFTAKAIAYQFLNKVRNEYLKKWNYLIGINPDAEKFKKVDQLRPRIIILYEKPTEEQIRLIMEAI